MVNIKDADGNLVPKANNSLDFEVTGGGSIVGVDNGYQANLSSFKASKIKAFNGKCVVIIQSNGKSETITLKASSNIGSTKKLIKIKTD